MENASQGAPQAPVVLIRQRYRAPPITGRGEPRTFKVFLYDQGVTQLFIVAAYTRRQAAELLQCSEGYLQQFGKTPSDDERERAELTPGQVWVTPIGDKPQFRKWREQKGTIFG